LFTVRAVLAVRNLVLELVLLTLARVVVVVSEIAHPVLVVRVL
jgi:hypothetical protein